MPKSSKDWKSLTTIIPQSRMPFGKMHKSSKLSGRGKPSYQGEL